MNPTVLDLETSISEGVHGPDFRDPSNDFYTIIYGDNPDRVQVEHNKHGFDRMLPIGTSQAVRNSNIIIGHNLGFDLSYVWNDPEIQDFIIKGGAIWDTQVAEYILTGQQHLFSSLEELQLKHLGRKEKLNRISLLYSDKKPSGKKKRSIGADEIIKASRRCSRVWNEYNKYCLSDGSSTLKIFKQQYIRAKQEGMLSIIRLYQDYLLALINMTCTGINLDVEQCEKTRTEFSLKSIEYLENSCNYIDKVWSNKRLPKFNINSPQHKSAVLFGGEIKNHIRTKVGKYKNGNDRYKKVEHKIWVDGFGVPTSYSVEGKTEGFYSVDKKAVLPKIFKDSKNPKLIKYLESQLKSSEFNDGVKVAEAFLKYKIGNTLYPNFNNTAVVTGRLSSSQPNLQNVTKKTAIGKALHRLFTAPPGWKCVQVDFAQLEIWVSALLSQDERLIEDLQRGIDMHCVRVSLMENCSYEHAYNMCKVEENQEWVKKRSAAKTFSYQRIYGAGVKKLSEFTGLSQEKIKGLIEKEEERYPKASKLWEEVRDSVNETKVFSKAIDKPASKKPKGSVEKRYNLLSIFDKYDNIVYNSGEYEKIGYWQSITGKKYHFPEVGNYGKHGLRRSVTPTILKNYPMQGTAADIQGATTAALLKILVEHKDKIQMINEVHDSKWFYVREDYVSRIVPRLRDIIEDVPTIFKERFGIDVPFKFPIDIEVGDNFAEMYSYTTGEC